MSPDRWDFISENRADFGVQRICRVLGASRAGFYRHLATAQKRVERWAEERRTVAEIRASMPNIKRHTARRASMPSCGRGGGVSTASG